MAARRMGYRVRCFDPTPDCPASHVCDHQTVADYDDISSAKAFAESVDVVTFEFENVPAQTLAAIEAIRPVHPSPFVLDTCRHRLNEKRFLSSNGFPVAPFRAVRGVDELRQAVTELGTPCILKSADYGYDGKGQVRIDAGTSMESAWAGMGRPLGVLEGFVRFDREISVIVARSAGGQIRCYDPAENVHTRHILDVTIAPAPIAPELLENARQLAEGIAEALKVVGLLAVEMFVVGQQVIVNELAPRPHNSGHHTFDAAITSQFEQHIRAVCGLPLGDPSLVQPAAMANLLGDLWTDGEPDWAAALGDPRVKLHLYGKHKPAMGRKMGHLTALAPTVEQARSIVIDARRRLSCKPSQACFHEACSALGSRPI